ncbi:hypothetical protein WBK31_39685 [Nonomuraea sp. N2-4H]|jgi:hypothetical protein|uniref:hypothetical protein n=1 Tax=Nonomuraea sp. N2-4H TaxID=3128898 RepID=UPI0032492042
MYRQAIAVLTATSAALLAPAATAHAEDDPAVTRAQCSDIDGVKVNVSPPPPLSGTVTTDDVRGLMESIVAGTSLAGFFAPGDAIESATAGEIESAAAGEAVPLSAAGPTPLPPVPSPSLPPLPFPTPTATPSPTVTPPPALSPAAAGEPATPSSRVESMLEALVDRAIACARSALLQGAQPRTQGASPRTAEPEARTQETEARTQETGARTQETEVSPVTQYFEALVTTKPICPATTRPASAQTSDTLFDVIGVPRLVDTVLASPLFCVQPDQVSQSSTTVSVLDSLGIIRVFDELLAL